MNHDLLRRFFGNMAFIAKAFVIRIDILTQDLIASNGSMKTRFFRFKLSIPVKRDVFKFLYSQLPC